MFTVYSKQERLRNVKNIYNLKCHVHVCQKHIHVAEEAQKFSE